MVENKRKIYSHYGSSYKRRKRNNEEVDYDTDLGTDEEIVEKKGKKGKGGKL